MRVFGWEEGGVEEGGVEDGDGRCGRDGKKHVHVFNSRVCVHVHTHTHTHTHTFMCL